MPPKKEQQEKSRGPARYLMGIQQNKLEGFRKHLYENHPDFGHYGSNERKDAAMSSFLKWADTTPEGRNMLFDLQGREVPMDAVVEEALNRVGETAKRFSSKGLGGTYSVGEFVREIGYPAAGGVLASPGGPIAAGGGMGAGAFIQDAEERIKQRKMRNLPTDIPAGELIKDHGPGAALETVFGLFGAPRADLFLNGARRRLMMPAVNKNVMAEEAQELLRGVQQETQPGMLAKWDNWISGKWKVPHSLTKAQVLGYDSGPAHWIESTIASSYFMAKYARDRVGRTREAIFKNFSNRIQDVMTKQRGAESWGRTVAASLQDEVNWNHALYTNLLNASDTAVKDKSWYLNIDNVLQDIINGLRGGSNMKNYGKLAAAINQYALGGFKSKSLHPSQMEIEFVPELAEKYAANLEEVLGHEITAEAAINLRKLFNSVWDKNTKGTIGHINGKLDVKLQNALQGQGKEGKDAWELFKEANAFFSESKKRLTDKREIKTLMTEMLDGVRDNPEYIVGFANLAGGDHAKISRNLRLLKEVYLGGRDVVQIRVPKGLEQEGLPVTKMAVSGRKLTEADWDRDIVGVLRWELWKQAKDEFGQVTSSKFRQVLQNMGMAIDDAWDAQGRYAPTYIASDLLNTIFPPLKTTGGKTFGGTSPETNLEHWILAIDAMDIAGRVPGLSSMMVNVIQAKMMASVVSTTGDSDIKKGMLQKSIGFFLASRFLGGRHFSEKSVRELTDGLTKPPGSRARARALASMATMVAEGAEDLMDMEEPKRKYLLQELSQEEQKMTQEKRGETPGRQGLSVGKE